MSAVIDSLMVKYPDLHACSEDINKAMAILLDSFSNGGKLLVCGNGGSASDSEHIVGELMKSFMLPRKLPEDVANRFERSFGDVGRQLGRRLQGVLPAISLVSNTTLISAISNDTDASMVYAQQVFGYGRLGDVLLAISTSGNSKNVVSAVQVAHVQGMKTIGLTGQTGGRLREFCDVTIQVPYSSTRDIQERHLPIYHALCVVLEEEFFG